MSEMPTDYSGFMDKNVKNQWFLEEEKRIMLSTENHDVVKTWLEAYYTDKKEFHSDIWGFHTDTFGFLHRQI